MKRNIRSIMAIILAVVLIGLIGAYSMIKLKSKKDGGAAPSESVSETAKTSAEQTSTEPDTTKKAEMTTQKKPSATETSEYAYAYAGFSPKVTKIDESKWYLTLVNRDYILPADYTVKTAKTVIDIYGGYDHGLLDYRVAPHYIEMYNAALEDGLKLSPLSGYRSIERQKSNFEARISIYMNQGYSKKQATIMASEIILPPQTSEHNAGLCMDILSIYESFENTKEYAWLQEHAADYGFILRYPKDKQDITHITFEPWHWRYVGVEAAKEIKAKGLCLEEYLGLA